MEQGKERLLYKGFGQPESITHITVHSLGQEKQREDRQALSYLRVKDRGKAVGGTDIEEPTQYRARKASKSHGTTYCQP